MSNNSEVEEISSPSAVAEIDKKSNQIFIRNLAFDTKAEDIEKLFGEHGPLKNASVVMENGVSRGFGFVKFAIPEDAVNAIKVLQGRELKGRRLKLELAVKKARGRNAVVPVETLDEQVKAERLARVELGRQRQLESSLQYDENAVADFMGENIPFPKAEVIPEVVAEVAEIVVEKKLKKKVSEEKEAKVENKEEIKVEKKEKKVQKTKEEKSVKEAVVKSKDKKESEKTVIDKEIEAVPVVKAVPGASLKLVILGVPDDITKKTMQMVVSKVVKKATVELIKQDNLLCESLQIVSPPGRVLLVTVPARYVYMYACMCVCVCL
jgi:hypothetical protein